MLENTNEEPQSPPERVWEPHFPAFRGLHYLTNDNLCNKICKSSLLVFWMDLSNRVTSGQIIPGRLLPPEWCPISLPWFKRKIIIWPQVSYTFCTLLHTAALPGPRHTGVTSVQWTCWILSWFPVFACSLIPHVFIEHLRCTVLCCWLRRERTGQSNFLHSKGERDIKLTNN